MKIFMVFMLVFVIAVFTGCDLGGGSPALVDSDIPILPVIGFGSDASNVRAITVSKENPNLGYAMYAPIITGWKSNTIGVKAGKTYSEDFLGKSIDISVTKTNEAGTITFNGTLADDCGTFTLVYDPSEKTFSYEHDIFLNVIEEGSTGWLRCEFADVPLDNKNYFHSNFTNYFMEWEQEDYDDWNSEPSIGDGVRISWQTTSEFYYGPSRVDDTIIVSGWAWKGESDISVAIDLDHAPGLADIDILRTFVGDEASFQDVKDLTFGFAYFDGTEFHDFIMLLPDGIPTTLDELQGVLPWILLL